MCGAPPVEGVKKITNKSNPFRINDQQIKAGNVPSEEKAAVHQRHDRLAVERRVALLDDHEVAVAN